MTDGVVKLRRFTIDDAHDVYEACQDPEISRWTATVPWPYPKEAATGWIESHDALWSGGLHAPFAVVAARDDRFLGSISIHLKPELQHAVAGYWIAADARNAGAATRGLALAVAWTKSHAEVPCIELKTVVGNVASERVAQKCGFQLVCVDDNYVHAGAPERHFHVKLWRRALG